MLSIELKPTIKIGMEEVLKAVADLDTPELEDFFQKIAEIVVQRKTAIEPNKESELLAKINAPALSNAQQEQYNVLYKKLQEETINESEYDTLNQLLQQVEKKGVERLKCFIELSKLKNKTVQELMIDLNMESLTPPIHV